MCGVVGLCELCGQCVVFLCEYVVECDLCVCFDQCFYEGGVEIVCVVCDEYVVIGQCDDWSEFSYLWVLWWYVLYDVC